MTIIRVSPSDTADGNPPEILTAVFRHPVTGADLPVTITLFQGGDPRHMGVGVYTPGADGQPALGTVLRFDDGPDAGPRVIFWERPHCADDQCGEPCGHREAAS